MKKILVIEDEEDLNQTLSFNLENEGYKVTSALKGVRGSKNFRRFGKSHTNLTWFFGFW